jgi:hypothetical protein
MTLGWALPVIAIRVLDLFAEKRSREDEVDHLLQITVNTPPDMYAGSFGAVLLLSLLTVEVVSYRVAAGHSFEALLDCSVAAAYTSKRHRCRSFSRRFCRNSMCIVICNFLVYLVRMTSILSLLSLVADYLI